MRRTKQRERNVDQTDAAEEASNPPIPPLPLDHPLCPESLKERQDRVLLKLLQSFKLMRCIAEQKDGLTIADGHIHASSPALQQEFDIALSVALCGDIAAMTDRVTFFFYRPSGNAAWRVEILPIQSVVVQQLHRPGGAVVIVSSVHITHSSRIDAIVRTCGLTPSEADLAHSLRLGRSVAEHAKRRRIALPTARTHLANLFRKTGCRRQAEFVARMSGSVP